jgi:uncharacterized protein YbjT (DUF2867 family)
MWESDDLYRVAPDRAAQAHHLHSYSSRFAMVKVAVAGGSSGIGLYIVEAIVQNGEHEVVVLSRKASVPHLAALGVTVHAVSYDDPASLAMALRGVHTVISTINGLDAGSMVGPQLALLDAAVTAGARRFAPSEFVFANRSGADVPIELYKLRLPVAEAARASGLEYTLFQNGLLMNYLASGTAGTGHMRPLRFIFDVENCKATIPGDGSMPFVMTRVEDIGQFVAASLGLEKWPEQSEMRGDRKTLKEILALAEAVRGKLQHLSRRIHGTDSLRREAV